MIYIHTAFLENIIPLLCQGREWGQVLFNPHKTDEKNSLGIVFFLRSVSCTSKLLPYGSYKWFCQNSCGSHKSSYLLCSLNLLLWVADMGEADKLQREVSEVKL